MTSPTTAPVSMGAHAPIPPAPASVVSLGATSCGAVAWQVRGQLRLTVIVKASFSLVPGAAMAPADAEELVHAELHHRNTPTQSIRLSTDLAPFLPAADALLTGHAHAPEGAPAQALTVRFAVFREQALVEKLIHVYGDRAGNDVAPFEQMPLVYERAFGGLGTRDNPFGTGAGAQDKRPNLVDPQDPTRTACFAPLSAAWPCRKRMLERAQIEGLKQPIAEIVGEVDWQYFHAAPPDQRIADYLRGNEWVVLDGMHPTERSVQSRLPDVAAAARVYGLSPGAPESTDDGGRAVVLVADTLRVDADRMTCSLVWRGHVPVPDEATLASLEVVGGVTFGDQHLRWPDRLEDDVVLEEYDSLSGHDGGDPHTSGAAPVPAPPPPVQMPPRALLDGTMEALPDEVAGARRPLPFVKGQAASIARPAPPAAPRPKGPLTMGPQAAPNPGLLRSPSLDAATVTFEGTLALPSEQDAVVRPLPFVTSPGVIALRNAPVAPVPAVAIRAPVPAVAPVATVAPEPLRRRAERTALGIELFPTPSLSIAVVPWGLAPSRDTLTVIAKATCDLVPDGPAVVRPAAEPPSGEVWLDGPPACCVHPSDLAPFKVRADVILVGHAVAPGGSATAMEVSFRFGAGDNGFARTVLVSGDRRWQKGRVTMGGTPKPPAALEPSAPEAFARMPLTFDRAFGGPRFAANPAGIGHHDPMRRGPVPLPNLEDPDQILRSPRQLPAPAVFAPIPLAWKDRWAATGESGLCLAEALDWTRFQAAPRPQQLAFLAGDEPFTLAGLSARHPTLAGTLPGLRARGFAARAPDRFDEVTLRLDTVVFDVDAMKLTLVWRGALAVTDEQRPDVQGLYLLADPLGAETPLADARVKLLRP